jgi:lipopolysaccharide/colanic/teichoic acid biosynthesis glycosyltransferase
MSYSELVLDRSSNNAQFTSGCVINGLFIGPQSQALREAITTIFDELTVSGSSVDTVEQALSILNKKTERFKFIICDVDADQRPLRSLANEARNAPSPILFLLYAPSFDAIHKAKAIELSADDYLYDALGLDNIVERIRFLVNLKTNPIHLTTSSSEVFRRPWKKRLLDVCVASVLLLTLSPLFLLIIILIKLESLGPAFFVSKRVGSNYEVFDFYKFRTMQVGADTQRENLKYLNAYYSLDRPVSGEPFFFKVKNDPRVTNVGRFLRKTSLDELPQLVNVLKGDMSLVGNRPLPLDEAASLTKDEWAARFLAPSGMTGLWQISKRKESMTTTERMELDLTYRNNMSLRNDLKILLKTLPGMFQQD